MPDVGALAVVTVEAVVASALVAAVEVLWLLAPHPASMRDATTTPTINTRHNPTHVTL
jgi:hypothetical protein